MNKDAFFNSMVNNVDHKAVLKGLFQGVIDTNTMISQAKNDMSKETLAKMLTTYEKLCIEEGTELKVAVEDNNRDEYLDAIVDYLVVGSYLAHLRGYTFNNILHNVGTCNSKTLKEMTECFSNYLAEGNFFTCLQVAQDIFVQLNIDHQKAVDEVLNSNLSKFPTLEELEATYDTTAIGNREEVITLQCEDIEKVGRYTGVYAKELLDADNNIRYSFWCTKDRSIEKTKYVKPNSFIEPKFNECWVNKS